MAVHCLERHCFIRGGYRPIICNTKVHEWEYRVYWVNKLPITTAGWCNLGRSNPVFPENSMITQDAWDGKGDKMSVTIMRRPTKFIPPLYFPELNKIWQIVTYSFFSGEWHFQIKMNVQSVSCTNPCLTHIARYGTRVIYQKWPNFPVRALKDGL